MLRQLFPPHADWIITDVSIQRDAVLGRGAYGEVSRATWKGCLVAAKKLHDIFFKEDVVPVEQCRYMVAEFAAECSLQAQLRHPNIVPLFGVFIPAASTDRNQKAPVMVTELMAETLRSRLLRPPRLTLHDIIDISLQIAAALRFLHEREDPIGHRDLSANNVMLTSSGVCKVGDVGLAKVFTTARRLTQTVKPGAELYMPGEALGTDARYNEKIDVFSLGVLILEMSLGHEPRPTAEFLVREEVFGRQVFKLIPENSRRRVELQELGGQHPLRPLIMRLLLSQQFRPAIGEVYQLLEDVRGSAAYSDSPSMVSSANVPSSRLASDLREVAQVVDDLRNRQERSNEAIQQLQQTVIAAVGDRQQQQGDIISEQLDRVNHQVICLYVSDLASQIKLSALGWRCVLFCSFDGKCPHACTCPWLKKLKNSFKNRASSCWWIALEHSYKQDEMQR